MTLSGCSASRNGISPSRVVGGQILPPNPTVGEGVLSPNEPRELTPDEILEQASREAVEQMCRDLFAKPTGIAEHMFGDCR